MATGGWDVNQLLVVGALAIATGPAILLAVVPPRDWRATASDGPFSGPQRTGANTISQGFSDLPTPCKSFGAYNGQGVNPSLTSSFNNLTYTVQVAHRSS
jgi:hypothetical protein